MSTLRVDTVLDAAGTGAPSFSNGINISQATGSFYVRVDQVSNAATGLTISPTIQLRFHKIGNIVHVTIPDAGNYTKDGSAGLVSFANAIPLALRPVSDQDALIAGNASGTVGTKACRFGADGSFTFGEVALSNITASSTVRIAFRFTTLQYRIDL